MRLRRIGEPAVGHCEHMSARFRPSLFTTVRPLEFRKRCFSPAMSRLWQRSIVAQHDGLALVDVSFRKELQSEFVRQSIKALELVQQHDPRRYSRIREAFDWVVHMELVDLKAQYWRWPAACILDFSRFPFHKSPDAVLILLAASLVHEATHALLFRRGISHTRSTYIEVERICCLEEARFAGHVNPRLRTGYFERRFKAAELERAYHAAPRMSLSILLRRWSESRRMSNEALQATAAPPRS